MLHLSLNAQRPRKLNVQISTLSSSLVTGEFREVLTGQGGGDRAVARGRGARGSGKLLVCRNGQAAPSLHLPTDNLISCLSHYHLIRLERAMVTIEYLNMVASYFDETVAL